MALVASDLTTAGSITGGSNSYVTASISPSSNALVLAWFVDEDLFGNPQVPSGVSGCSLTWVQIDTVNYGSNCRLTLYRALSASPTSGTVTFSLPFNAWSAIWSIMQITGVSTGGTNGSGAITQSAQNNDPASGNTLTVTLAAIQPGSMVAAGFSFNINDNAMTLGANWTDLASAQIARPLQILSGYNLTQDNTATATSVNGGSRGGIAVEIGGPPPPPDGNATRRSVFMRRQERWG